MSVPVSKCQISTEKERLQEIESSILPILFSRDCVNAYSDYATLHTTIMQQMKLKFMRCPTESVYVSLIRLQSGRHADANS